MAKKTILDFERVEDVKEKPMKPMKNEQMDYNTFFDRFGRKNVNRFFMLFDPPIHLYLKAYLEPLFRGKIQTEEEWFEELKQYMEKE